MTSRPPDVMAVYEIRTPTGAVDGHSSGAPPGDGYSGTVAGLTFTHGIAETSSAAVARRFEEAGYWVNGYRTVGRYTVIAGAWIDRIGERAAAAPERVGGRLRDVAGDWPADPDRPAPWSGHRPGKWALGAGVARGRAPGGDPGVALPIAASTIAELDAGAGS